MQDIGDLMSIHEAARLAEILLHDPSSATAAAVQGWDHPISHESIVLTDLFDLTLLANSDPKKPKPKPHGLRPWKPKHVQHMGDTGGRSREQVIELLQAWREGRG